MIVLVRTVLMSAVKVQGAHAEKRHVFMNRKMGLVCSGTAGSQSVVSSQDVSRLFKDAPQPRDLGDLNVSAGTSIF